MTSKKNFHIHIIGICGTFMASLAAIGKELGYKVTGSDQNVYPPMSTALEQLGIQLVEGFEADQLKLNPDLIIVGNIAKRGMPVIEAMLNEQRPYMSGPEWLAQHVLNQRWVFAITGTHGKTTTTTMLSWVLDQAGLNPGFLIGGVPIQFPTSARLGSGPFFVIEGDEYDTAFFDKRAKFVHYRPKTVILNNLEYDHADIYPDLDSIKRQFHHMIRVVPSQGKIIANGHDSVLKETLDMGCYTPVEFFSTGDAAQDWYAETDDAGVEFEVFYRGVSQGVVSWNLSGRHNVQNALAVIAAAYHARVEPWKAIEALCSFQGVKRRLECRATVGGVYIYDDFAHHPTAIEATLLGLKSKMKREGQQGRVIAVLEPRSHTMKMGVHRGHLGASFRLADQAYLFEPADLGWSLKEECKNVHPSVVVSQDVQVLIDELVKSSQPQDHIVVMSNGGFNNFHERLIQGIAAKQEV